MVVGETHHFRKSPDEFWLFAHHFMRPSFEGPEEPSRRQSATPLHARGEARSLRFGVWCVSSLRVWRSLSDFFRGCWKISHKIMKSCLWWKIHTKSTRTSDEPTLWVGEFKVIPGMAGLLDMWWDKKVSTKVSNELERSLGNRNDHENSISSGTICSPPKTNSKHYISSSQDGPKFCNHSKV